jgi:hypothetical protein
MPERGQTEPRRGAEWWGEAFFAYFFWRLKKSEPP